MYITQGGVSALLFGELRHALRLGDHDHWLAVCRRFQNESDRQHTFRMAAEQAGISCDRCDQLYEWTRLKLDPGFAEELRQARKESAAFHSLSSEQRSDAAQPVPIPREPPPERAQTLIIVRPGELSTQIGLAEAALMTARTDVFQRAGSVVRVTWTADEAVRVTEVDEQHLLELFGRSADWVRFDARTKQYVPTSCPRDVARGYLARAGIEWRLPEMKGVIHAPTLNADGGIRSRVGFDRFGSDGLFLNDGPGLFYDIPDRPNWFDADDAADVLHELLIEFPFVGEADFSVAFAAILTALVRRSLPTAPLFAFTAPAPGTGKSLLVDLVSVISTGQPARGFTWPDDPAEQRKQLDAALLDGATAIHLDNVRVPVGGDRLNQLLTQGSATVRVLGQSKNVEVRCSALVTANGNNLAIEADATRRTLLCTMDARCERPELRQFRSDPLAAVLEDRSRYVAAALTILRAYHVAGRPGQPKPLGSFEAWSSLVRGAVLWLGLADPVATMDSAREVDPRGAELAAVLGQWNEHLGDRRVTTADVTVVAAASGAAAFREALLAVAGTAGAINTKRLGMWLQANKGRLTSGLAIKPEGKNRLGVATWVLQGGRSASDVVPFRAKVLP